MEIIFPQNFVGNTPFSSSFLCSLEKSLLILSLDCLYLIIFFLWKHCESSHCSLSSEISYLQAYYNSKYINCTGPFDVETHVLHLIWGDFHECFCW